MRRYTSLLMLLSVLVFLGSMPLSTVARDDRRNNLDQQHRSKTEPDGGKHVRPAPREQYPRKQAPRTDQRTTRQTHKVPPRKIPRSAPRTTHDRYYRKHRHPQRRHYRYYPTYHYHTYYLAPILYPYYSIGYSLAIIPDGYVRIVVGGLPYYYYSGVYYRYIDSAYIVVQAPIGALVHELPVGFIAFSLGAFTYFYVNEIYYLWDDDQQGYVVVKKPEGAEKAIATETRGRLYVYPKKGQNEDQQAKDRYACHRWAVKETGADPTEADEPLPREQNSNYKRAITACLEGRGYTVK